MHTIRGRLVFWYAVALGATMFLYALTINLVQQSQNLAELDARARLEADVIAALLGVAHRERGGAVAKDPQTGRFAVAPAVVPQVSVIPDYVVVLDSSREVLYLSEEARALPFASLEQLRSGAVVGDSGRFGRIRLDAPAGELRYYSRPIKGSGPVVRWVVSGASTAGLTLGPQRLFFAMFVIGLVILPVSTLIGYVLVGRTLEPVDSIVDEVEAITDGRSLHRRLVEPKTGDELARLSTTLNAMLTRLERSFISLRRFTADASHELKTPLTVLRSGIERAITHPDTSPEVLEVLEETLIEVNRMAEMVDSLLMLARADEGRAPLHLEDVDLRDMLPEVAETASILGEHAGVSVSVNIPAEPIVFAADRDRIRQLFMNLLTNAIKYTPRGGSVWIETAIADGQVTVNVRDTGIGIAPGDLPNIFDRFWRADAARSRTGQRPGAGLGLAICKWIAEAHGGTIVVQSRPGRGTTFTVTLPVGAEALPRTEEPAAADL